MTRPCILLTGALAALWALESRLPAAEEAPDWPAIRSVLSERCYDCHGGKKTKGGIDLKRLDSDPKVGSEFALWEKVRKSVSAGDMPPEEKPELAPDVKARLTRWTQHSLEEAIRAHAGDPGTVTMRRLTNAEYDFTIRDLTGLDLGLGKGFLPDGGGGEGFSNIGDVLFVSPQQLDKYFAAARTLADHATILPGTGIEFQPQRVGLRGPEQVKAQAEQALYVWYQKMAGPYLPKDGEDEREGAYMLACWKWKHRSETGAASLAALAEADQLSTAFLENWWAVLNSEQPKSRFLDLTRVAWRDLPGPAVDRPTEVPASVTQQIAAIDAQRKSWNHGIGMIPNVQRAQQDADGLRPYKFYAEIDKKSTVHLVLGDDGDGARGDLVIFSDLLIQRGKKEEPYLPWLRARLEADRQALSAPPVEGKPALDHAAIQARITEAEAALALFGKHPLGSPIAAEAFALQAPAIVSLPVPPDAYRFRATGQLDLTNPEAEFATAQWMATTGPTPDPTKIIPGQLTIWKRQTAAASATMNDFNVMKTAFPDEYLRRTEEVARNFERGGHGFGVYYFSDAQLLALLPPEEKARLPRMLEDWRFVRHTERLPAKEEQAWDENLRGYLQKFAALAWRHPLSPEEVQQIDSLYASARARELDRESSAREVMVRLLVSPNFLFKLEHADVAGEQPVNPWDLATRLSYFLWSTMPDEALRTAAADGSLRQPEVLAAQVRRMLHDPRAEAMAQEFAGQWLEFSGFSQHNTVDQMKFPEFTPELRADLYREASTFLSHVIRDDCPIREVISADYTFLNKRLAAYYGVPGIEGDDFQKVPVAQYQRGGILGMGALLTKTSYPNRTSPVLRGNWVLHDILGTPTPPPPNDVPKLDDSAAKATTLRARLEAHRANQACAGCHDKIDPIGFALENYDAIGRLRTSDEFGQPVDNSAKFKDGTAVSGLDGLRRYLLTHEGEFNQLFCRKLLGYALGRTILPTDRPLLQAMSEALEKPDGRFSTAVLAVAGSRQFQYRKNE